MSNYNYVLIKDPQIVYPINDLDLPFENYIAICQSLIQKTRIASSPDPVITQTIIEANSPFELAVEKPSIAALLIHGLFDCPFIMKDIALTLQQQGILTRSVLLPGHGTVPGGLLNVHYHDWLQTVAYGVTSLKKIASVKKIFLIGFSTGGSLALHHLLKEPFDPIVAGLILLAPAIKIYSRLAFAAGWLSQLSAFNVRGKWFVIREEIDYTKYQSIALNAVAQVYQLTQLIAKLSQERTIPYPILAIANHNDKTVSSKATLQYFLQHANQRSEFLYYAPSVMCSYNPRILTRQPKAYGEEQSDFSHAALPISPENFHYGVNGDYNAVASTSQSLRGDVNSWEVLTQSLGRCAKLIKGSPTLRHNPDFHFMINKINQFIQDA